MIPIKTTGELQVMREGGTMLAQVIEELAALVKPGMTTGRLDLKAEELIVKAGAEPAFKGYQGFPRTMCTSVNEEVVHAVPSDRELTKGDVVTLDLGLIHKGMYVDMARTYPVGEVSPETAHLLKATKKALRLGIKKVRHGNTVGDIGNTIQRFIESQGYNVVRDLCGHGIGRELHEEPKIVNFGKRHTDGLRHSKESLMWTLRDARPEQNHPSSASCLQLPWDQRSRPYKSR